MERWIAKLRKLLGFPDPDYPKPPLQQGEEIIREGRALFTKGFWGVGRGGPLMVTNHRILWYEDSMVPWPLKRITGDVNHSDIKSVDKATLFEFLFGGTRLRLRLSNGKDKCFWVVEINEWVATIRSAMADRQHIESSHAATEMTTAKPRTDLRPLRDALLVGLVIGLPASVIFGLYRYWSPYLILASVPVGVAFFALPYFLVTRLRN